MYDILNTDEFVEVDGRRYANPQLTIDESNQFIDNLRSTQQANNQEIQTQTYNLGTAVPSNLGGLTSPVTDGNGGAGLSYFTSRYQTPQTNATIANLRATAQAAALSQALQNEQEMWKKKYNDAYRNYQKRASSGGGGRGGGGGLDLSDLLKNLGVDVNPDDPENTGKNKVDVFKEKPGTVIPLTDKSNKYQDAKTGQWFVLTTPTAKEGYQIVDTWAGQHPVDGKTVTIDGKVFRYDGGTGMWYRQTYMFGQGR